MIDQEEFGLGVNTTDSSLVPRAILEISETVNSTNNLDELFIKVHQIISQYIPADNFYIALYNCETKEITYPYYVDNLKVIAPEEDHLNQALSITNFALHQNNPIIITSRMLKDLIKTGKISNQEVTFSEWLGIPLKTNDKKTIGLLAFQRRENDLVFSESHKSFLRFVSTQIAAAIQYKQDEENLRGSEKKFKTLYKQNPLMLFIIDQDGIVLDGNERVHKDLGYKVDELIGKNVMEVFHPDDRSTVVQNLKECLRKQGYTHRWELRKVAKDGSIVWVRESASTLNLPGENINVLIACENITDYKAAQLQLVESEEKYRLLTENIHEMILLHDKNGKIIYVNEAGIKLSGKSSAELVGSNVFNLFRDDYKENVLEYLFDEKKKDSLFLYEINIETKNSGNIPLEINITKLKKRGKQENLLVVARDIRERLMSEQNIRKYNDELKKSNYAKDKFFSIIAHDLRSPFNALLSYSDILVDEFPELERDEIKEYVTHMRNVSKNIFDLLNNLLDWSRIQTDKMYFNPELIDVESVLHKTLEVFNDIASNKNINIVCECDDRSYAYADENMVSTIIRNLLSNAIKFSNENSSVIVKCINDDDTLRISVEDSGIGMLREDISKLFRIDINYTTLGTHKEKGTGLGLILAKEMIEKNGGEIFVTSNLGEGSKFEFTLPRRLRMEIE